MAVDLPGSGEEDAARIVIEQASTSLSGRRRDIPATFIAQLYSRAVPEDVVRYGGEDLSALAERAYDFIADRAPGAPKIRCETVPLAASADRKAVTVVEIVNDDMPFLVDSVMGEIADRRLDVRLVAHPMFGVRRKGSKLVALGAPDSADSTRESFIQIHLIPMEDKAREELMRALDLVLGDVRLAVQDWRAMLDRVNAIVMDLKTNPPPLRVDEIAEAIQFLQWLLADNFTFLGVRDYRVEGQGLEPNFDSALGIMRSQDLRVLRRGTELLEITPEIMAFLKEPRPLIIAKANIHARVHRRVYLDYIGVKRFDASGNLVGEHRIIGLFTSTAYTRAAHSIPYLRRKIAAVEERAGFDPGSHSGKALANVLEHYPRDELFQIDEDTLYSFALAILQLDERPRVRVLA
jgi:glutamate dehydrogenase